MVLQRVQKLPSLTQSFAASGHSPGPLAPAAVMYALGHWGGTEVAETMLAPVIWNNEEPCQLSYLLVGHVILDCKQRDNTCRRCTRSPGPSRRTSCTWGTSATCSPVRPSSAAGHSCPARPSRAVGTLRRQCRHAMPPCTVHRTNDGSVGT